MLHEIVKDGYSATISCLGAELKSFKDSAGEEYIWSGHPDIWKGTAPILFPIVGQLRDGQYSYNGKFYRMARHGIARTRMFAHRDGGRGESSFVLTSSPEMEPVYPFQFELEARFRIEKERLVVTYRVKNTGDELMPFTLGSHPAFALPIDECDLESYCIEFEKNETLDLFHLVDGLLCREPRRAFLNNEKTIRITKQLFNNDALIFKNIKSREIHIHRDGTGRRLTLDTGGAPYLGIWAKPAAPYICLEPWYGHADEIGADYDIRKKSGIITLPPGEEFTAGYEIRL
jgi:galactose mutarotase-like enzyme